MTEIKHEQRSVVVPVELRAKGDSGQTIAGYAAIFGETADIGGYFRESIAKGAFAVSIASDDVRAYFDHDRGRVLGRSSRSEENTSELQSLMRISYAVSCLKKKNKPK